MMISAIARQYLAASHLYASLSERSIVDAVPASQVALEADCAKALAPVLEAYYAAPLAGGIARMPTSSAAAIEDWLSKKYGEHPEWATGLIAAIVPFLKEGLAVGVTEGLGLIGGPEEADVTNEELLTEIEDRARDLMEVDVDSSLAQTTIKDLGKTLFNAVTADVTVSVALAALAGHILARSVLIAEHEISRTVNIGLVETYGRNGVVHMTYETRDDDACKICKPDNKKDFLIPPKLLLPRHPHCRCMYSPNTTNWNPPKEWWTGA